MIYVTAAVLLSVLTYDVVIVGRALLRGQALAAASEPFSSAPTDSVGAVLVVGDSTAVGTGADRPSDSLAGRLAAANPHFTIYNLASDGALTADAAIQLRSAPPLPRCFDLVLVQVGGNDALRFTRLSELARNIDDVLHLAQQRAVTVVLMSVGDLGTAPAIPWPFSALLSRRARAVHTLFARRAQAQDITYVDLFATDLQAEAKSDQKAPAAEIDGGTSGFASNPERFYAHDGLHASSEGYRLWFERFAASTAFGTDLSIAGQGQRCPEPYSSQQS